MTVLVDTPDARALREKRVRDRAAAEALYPPITREEFTRRIAAAHAAGERHIELVVIRQGCVKVPTRVQVTFPGDVRPGPRSCEDTKVRRVAPDCYLARFLVADSLLCLGRRVRS